MTMSTRWPAQVKRTTAIRAERSARTGAYTQPRAASPPSQPRTAIVTGATGQDGYFLVRKLLDDGWTVHAAVRDVAARRARSSASTSGCTSSARPARPGPALRARRRRAARGALQPRGRVAASARRSPTRARRGSRTRTSSSTCSTRCARDSPATRFYQASSGEMFGSVPGESVVHDEASALNPQSPYAAAKAAAHLLCRSYRESYGLRIACGILFNHESHRRGGAVPLAQGRRPPARRCAPARDRRRCALGNLKAQRDWGFAPDYVDGMIAILRQAVDPRRARRGALLPRLRPRHRPAAPRLGARRPRLRARRLRARLAARRRRPARVAARRSPTRASRRWSSTRRSSARPTRWRSPPTRAGSPPTSAGSRAAASTSFLEDMLAAGAPGPGEPPLSRRGTAARRARTARAASRRA